MTNLKLYSAWYCPFAQRAWMGLLHKGTDFDYLEVDPYEKTPEWMKISRGTGQVPVIVDESRDITIPDSMRVLEYLDARYSDAKFSSERPLYPKSSSERANANY